MLKLVQFSLLCVIVGYAVGCNGGGTAKGPTEEEAAKNNAKMQADMKTMMLPKKPGGK